ncbi:Methyltransferase type 11 [Desulfarculus baarsii DSM 2075]|uniref:Methyltransferase type 11 n=1 Tax=Desulfarculus baarsii (strain ATCC 33931 / DSM 2075 / LMG 7858 / VKM B-1802 / 2st14) TaxID=644282 RepID=E1QHJ4_DESB2|nr:methyltransferase domain-containing protein [Desulfarculus baarsii]ADK85037.1 Methyltransferase type 11 [Desulfarculus baarsii DSM 2075]
MIPAVKMQDLAVEMAPLGRQFWEDAWRRANEASFLKTTQEIDPKAWDRFYDEVSDIYLDLWGQPETLGRAVVDELLANGVVGPGASVLDVGCGPGTLAIPLAKAGARVTALDNSAGMLAALKRQSFSQQLEITTINSNWRDHRPARKSALALAGFFPPALSPEGLARLESWSSGHCALTLGTGHEPYEFRRELWGEVLQMPFHKGSHHLSCAVNYLIAAERRPNLRHLHWTSRFCQPVEKVARFYRSYFGIFGRRGPEVDGKIASVLRRHCHDGMVLAQGSVQVAVLWWACPRRLAALA